MQFHNNHWDYPLLRFFCFCRQSSTLPLESQTHWRLKTKIVKILQYKIIEQFPGLVSSALRLPADPCMSQFRFSTLWPNVWRSLEKSKYLSVSTELVTN